MTLGTILAASFQVMRRNPRTTLVPGLVLALALAVASSAGIAAYFGALDRVMNAGRPEDQAALAASSALIAMLVALAAIALTVVASALLQGLVVAEVARGTVGEKLTFGRLWALHRTRFGALIGYSVLMVVAIGIVIAVLFGILFAITYVSSANVSSRDVGSMILTALGGTLIVTLGGIVLWAWLSTKLLFVPAAIVLERLPIGAAIGRSWSLTTGAFWRTFGIMLLVQAMIYIATQIVSTPVSLLGMLGTSLLDPTGAANDPTTMLGTMTGMLVAIYAVTSLVQGIGLVIVSATSSLLYLDRRMRREGLDLELARYVEAKQSGADLPDPYLRNPAAP
jgi:membrane-anchored glycerophosphoryl diester phosphodiesterase (GDPDase)